MNGICGVDSSQHDPCDFTLYKDSGRDKNRSRRPLYPQICNYLITGVLYRSDCTETCLAENIKTSKPAIVSYLIPKVEFDPLSDEYKNFHKVGTLLAKKNGIRFLPEGKIKRAARQLRGYSLQISGSDDPIAEFHCAFCNQQISTETINTLRSMKDFYSCACGNEIRLKYINVTVPVLIQKYKDQISLKRALTITNNAKCAVPNLIFCWLISVTAKHIFRIKPEPILISSQAIALCADGTSMYLYTPVGSRAKKLHRREIPQHIAKFFELFLSYCPDESGELSKFIALPNLKTLRNVKQLAKVATRTQVQDWLKYIVASGNKEGSQLYQPVQAMIVPNLEEKKVSFDQTLSPTDKDLHRGAVSLSELQQIEIVHERNKKHAEEKAERKTSWQKYLQTEPQSPKSAIDSLVLMVRRIPVWQKYAFAGTGSILIVFLALFSMASIQTPNAKRFSDVRAVLKSSPARLVQDSIADELQQRISNTVATARILISEDGRVEKIEWVYATREQQNAYGLELQYLRFESAKQNGVPAESWQTIQLPIKPREPK